MHAKAEPLEPDEDVLFLPGTARVLEYGRIEVDLQAWIQEKDRHNVLDAVRDQQQMPLNTFVRIFRHA